MPSELRDLVVHLPDRAGALATLGEALARVSVSIEGGGAFAFAGRGVAHFLLAADRLADARAALAAAGLDPGDDREVVTVRLAQERPGQLGAICRAMADAGVNIEVLYSDHANQLCLVVDDPARGRAVAAAWRA